jgi:hypothetical protein
MFSDIGAVTEIIGRSALIIADFPDDLFTSISVPEAYEFL